MKTPVSQSIHVASTDPKFPPVRMYMQSGLILFVADGHKSQKIYELPDSCIQKI